MDLAGAVEKVEVVGHVTEAETGEPLSDVKVEVYNRRFWRRHRSNWERVGTQETGEDGEFKLFLDEGGIYMITMVHRDGGVIDYVPYGLQMTPDLNDTAMNVELQRCAQIEVRGLAYFVETSSIPSTALRVIDAETGEGFKSGSLSLSYGSLGETFSSFIDVPGDVVIVPADTPFKLEVQSSVTGRSEVLSRKLTVDAFSEGLAAGESRVIDLRSHVLPDSVRDVANLTDTVEALLLEKESEGFYLAVERQRLNGAARLVAEAEAQMDVGAFEESFTSLREAYITLKDVQGGVEGTIGDAARSTGMLIMFIAVTSIVISGMAYDQFISRTVGMAVCYVSLLGALMLLHPGALIIAQSDFIFIAAASFVAVNMVAYFLPRLLARSEGGEKVPIVNLVPPMLSVAKRSLRRRRVRFGLTLISVLMLVASFISLTSFSSGYGLAFNRYKQEPAFTEGVIIRSPNPPPVRSLAPFCGGDGVGGSKPLDEGLIDWFMDDADPLLVVPKYSNQPRRQYREAYTPFGRLEGVPLFGYLAVIPSLEASMNRLDSAVVEGRYLTDAEENTTLISVALAERLGKTLGDTVTLNTGSRLYTYTVVGLLGDLEFMEVTDLDGDPIIPQKIIEMDRIELDGPDIVIEGLAYCDPGEVMVVNQETAWRVSNIWLQRVNIAFPEGYDLLGFATSTALNRGFRVWASAEGAVFLAELSSYYQGKGLPVLIPWVIVVLNVVMTMLNSYYERRHDVSIYSSIGMNPSHVTVVFLTEAAVIGVIGGCLGYLLGLSMYKLIFMASPTLQVKQKISALWSLAAIGMSLSAVLIGGLVAVRNSTVITPSLRRRWRAERTGDANEPYNIKMPMNIYSDEAVAFAEFMEDELRAAEHRIDMATSLVRVTRVEEPLSWVYSFNYRSVDSTMSGIYTRNTLHVKPNEEGVYIVVLECMGDDSGAQETGVLLRHIGMDWSLHRSERKQASED